MSTAKWQNIAGSKKFFTLMDILNIFGPLKWLRDIWMVPYSMSSSINMKSNKRETGNRETNWCKNKAEYVSISSIGNWWWPDVPTKAYDPWIVTYATEVPLPVNPDPCNNLSQPHWHHFLKFVKLTNFGGIWKHTIIGNGNYVNLMKNYLGTSIFWIHTHFVLDNL